MSKKLSSVQLARLVREEASKIKSELGPEAEAEVVDAADLADTLEKDIDILAALKIEESKLREKLALIESRKTEVFKKIRASSRK